MWSEKGMSDAINERWSGNSNSWEKNEKHQSFTRTSILILNYVSSPFRSSSPSLSYLNCLFSLPSISFLRYAYKNSRKRTLRSCGLLSPVLLDRIFVSLIQCSSSQSPRRSLSSFLRSRFFFFFFVFFFRNSPGDVTKSLLIPSINLLTHLSTFYKFLNLVFQFSIFHVLIKNINKRR